MKKELSIIALTLLMSLSCTGCNKSGSYTITWENYDGTVLEIDTDAPKGTVPQYDGKVPVREADQYTYVWSGWTPNLEVIKGDMTYTAKYERTPIEYTIEYVTWYDEVNESNPTSYNVESPNINLLPTTLEGYDFEGWYKDYDCTEKITCIPTGSYGDLVLYANYVPTTYTITYVLDGGVNDEDNPTTYDCDTSFWLGDAYKEGYDFDGWYLDPEFKDYISRIYYGTIGDLTLYAKFTPIVYKIYYYLNGGSVSETAPLEYTVEDEFVLEIPVKKGYTFLGWTDRRTGESLTKIEKGHFGTLSIEANWSDANSYQVTLDPNGGSVSETSFDMTYDSLYTLPTPTRDGYEFTGWYDGETLIPLTGKWNVDYNASLMAAWEAIEYDITYNLNDGENNKDNPSTYTIEDEVTLLDASKTGYTFVEWQNELGSSVTKINKGSTGDITLNAIFSANLNEINLTTEDSSKGTVSIISGEGYTDEEITIKCTLANEVAFKGWYDGDTFVSNKSTYTFNMPGNDVNYKAKFYTEEEKVALGVRPIFSNDGKTVSYGLYPQTHVNDAALVTNLNTSAVKDINGWYKYDGLYYVKVKANPTNDSIKFDDGVTIVKNDEYWFRCDPIKWHVLSNNDGEALLLTERVIDAHNFCDPPRPNNAYEESAMRRFLNNEMYPAVFNLNNDYVKLSNIPNTDYCVRQGYVATKANNTDDYLFLLTADDYQNTSYGFLKSWNSNCPKRLGVTTDWLRAKGCSLNTNQAYLNGTYYYTRSTDSGNSVYANAISTTGSGQILDTYNNSGVRPAMILSVSDL